MFKAILSRALKISSVGITFGILSVVAGWVLPGGAETVGAASGILFWALAVLVPATAYVLTQNDLLGEERALYARARDAYLVLETESILGVALAAAFIWALATNAPVALGSMDARALQQAWSAHVGLAQYLTVLLITIVGAALIARWAHQSVGAMRPGSQQA